MRFLPLWKSVVLLAALLPLPIWAQSVGPPGGLLRGERWSTDFSKHTVPLEEISSGGPPKDGIPAIDRPRFVSVDDADAWMSNGEPVALLQQDGETKVYPLQILIWHEIVNDRVGDTPVTVTFCPLCNTTLAFDRRLRGYLFDFGTTGRLRHSDLVMYDRQTETWWQQATGEAIVGELAGDRLTFIPAPVVSWREIKDVHPDAAVLSRNTGYDRPYGRNPYPGYDRQRNPIRAFFDRDADSRLPAMERVLGLWTDDEALAIPFRDLEESVPIHLEFGGRSIVAFWAPETRSALDAERMDRGRTIGSTGAFESTLGGRELTFTRVRDGRFRDRETESRWTVSGEAIDGPLSGQRLTPGVHGNHFWFAWAAFQPRTRLYED